MLLYFLQGVTFGFAAAVQPGPFQTYLITQTVSAGWRRALPAVFAPLVSDGPIIALVLLVLVRVPEAVLQMLRLAGGVFVIYLAYGAFKTWLDFKERSVPTHASKKSLLKAAFVNLLSPGPYLFWSLVGGPLLLTGWHEAPARAVGLLLGFYVTIIGTMAAGVGVLATTGRLEPRVNRILLGISALALFGMGIYQIWLGLHGILK